MRSLIVLALLIIMPVLASADLQWRKHDVNAESWETVAFGPRAVTIDSWSRQRFCFPDELFRTVKSEGEKTGRLCFSSANYAAPATHRNLPQFHPGPRSGATPRVDHVMAWRLERNLDELVDVRSLYNLCIHPHNAMRDLMEYRLRDQPGRIASRFIAASPSGIAALLQRRL